jgi:hypothetical protein
LPGHRDETLGHHGFRLGYANSGVTTRGLALHPENVTLPAPAASAPPRHRQLACGGGQRGEGCGPVGRPGGRALAGLP